VLLLGKLKALNVLVGMDTTAVATTRHTLSRRSLSLMKLLTTNKFWWINHTALDFNKHLLITFENQTLPLIAVNNRRGDRKKIHDLLPVKYMICQSFPNNLIHVHKHWYQITIFPSLCDWTLRQHFLQISLEAVSSVVNINFSTYLQSNLDL